MVARPPITVVGAGVVGLSCALRLLEEGYAVDVVTREPPLETTSAIAGGFWFPHLVLPIERVKAWSAEGYAALADLAATAPESGVRLVHGRERRDARPADEELWWAEAVADLEVGDDGFSFTSPVVEMPVYLPWLAARVEAAGGRFVLRELTGLAGLTELTGSPGDRIVVNCSGLGARELVGDTTVHPVRGQVVLLEPCGVEEWAMDERNGSTYVFPRGGDVVVGGTEDHHAWDRTPDPATAAAILARATALVPALAGARVLGHRVGLRPARPAVRLEREGRVVHCYGHGGAGVTLSWGCASEVVRLVGAPPAG